MKDELSRIRYEKGFGAMQKRIAFLGFRPPDKSMIKTDKEILGCIEAGKVNTAILDELVDRISVGISTLEIDAIAREICKKYKARAACLGYRGFPGAVCTSIDDVICHGIPNERDIIREGNILNVDLTVEYEGYFGDSSRMLTFGKITDTARRLINTTERALASALSEIRPYESTLGDIGFVINELARKEGFSVVREIGGHGIGLSMHEPPYVCHVGSRGEGIMLVPGMIFTIEPMINEGDSDFLIDRNDGWTVRTRDGSLSAQIEHEVLVTEDSYRILAR